MRGHCSFDRKSSHIDTFHVTHMQTPSSPMGKVVCDVLHKATPGPWESLFNNLVLPYLGPTEAKVRRRHDRMIGEIDRRHARVPSRVVRMKATSRFARHARAFDAVHDELFNLWHNQGVRRVQDFHGDGVALGEHRLECEEEVFRFCMLNKGRLLMSLRRSRTPNFHKMCSSDCEDEDQFYSHAAQYNELTMEYLGRY